MAHQLDDEQPPGTVSDDRLARSIASVDSSDTERAEPPVGLWDRIAASTAEDLTSAGAGTVVEYCIDADDVVVSVGGDWMGFARANDAPELESVASDRTLWSYFEGAEVRELWRILIERTRATGAEAVVPFRCDAPHMRRWFEMRVTPDPYNRVRFRSTLVFEEARPEIALLGRESEHDTNAAAIPLCSWCDRGYDNSRWLTIDQLVHASRALEEVPVPPVIHGICPGCREQMSAESERLLSEGTR